LFLGEKLPLVVDNLKSFYKKETKKIVDKELPILSKRLNLYPLHLSFRKTKRRWGSCSYKNEISF